jgi:hypothetical protein
MRTAKTALDTRCTQPAGVRWRSQLRFDLKLCDAHQCSKKTIPPSTEAHAPLTVSGMGGCYSLLDGRHDTGQFEVIVPVDLFVYVPGRKYTRALEATAADTALSLRQRYVAADSAGASKATRVHVKRLTRSRVAKYLQVLSKEDASAEEDAKYAWTGLLASGDRFHKGDSGFEAVNVVYALALSTLMRAKRVASDPEGELTDSVFDPERIPDQDSKRRNGSRKQSAPRKAPAWDTRRERVQQLLVEAAEELQALKEIRNAHYPNEEAVSALPVDLQDAVIDALLLQCLGHAEMVAVVRGFRAKLPKATAGTLPQHEDLSGWAASAHAAMARFEEALTVLEDITPTDAHSRTEVDGERLQGWVEYLRFRLRTSTAWARMLQGMSLWSQDETEKQNRGAALAACHDGFETLEAARRHVHKTWCGRERTQRESVLTALTQLEMQFMRIYEPIANQNMNIYLVGRDDQPPALPTAQPMIPEPAAWLWSSAAEAEPSSEASLAPEASTEISVVEGKHENQNSL